MATPRSSLDDIGDLDLTQPLGPALESLATALGVEVLYVVDHEFAQLSVVHGVADDIRITDSMVNPLAEGEILEDDGGGLIPFHHDDLPLLVGRSGSPRSIAPSPHAAGIFSEMLTKYEWLERRRRSRPMTPAGQIQWDELPIRALRTEEYRVGGTLAPAYEVAGDLFDMALQPDGSLSAVAIDAMGHGVTAALSAVLALSAIRARRREGADLQTQMESADQAVAEEFGENRFVTGVAMSFSADSIEIVNAGHEPLRRGTATSVTRLAIPAYPPLGVEGRTRYVPTMIEPLAANEYIAMLSDGAGSARADDGTVYGDDGVNALLRETSDDAPIAMAHHLTRSVTNHSGGRLSDDVTALVVKALPG